MADIIITDAELAPIRAFSVEGPDIDGDYRISGNITPDRYVYTGYISPKASNLVEARDNALATLVLLEHLDKLEAAPTRELAEKTGDSPEYLAKVLRELGLKVVAA